MVFFTAAAEVSFMVPHTLLALFTTTFSVLRLGRAVSPSKEEALAFFLIAFERVRGAFLLRTTSEYVPGDFVGAGS